jgi:hypothetical protein
MIDKIYVIDDIVSGNYQERIKETLFDTVSHPWHLKHSLSESTSGNEDTRFTQSPGFVNVFYNDDGILNQTIYDLFLPVVKLACKEINFEFHKLLYARSFLQMPLATHQGITNPHVDISIPHLVCLYYVNDSDGETVFFNRIDEPVGSPRPTFDDATIANKVEPKQGRMVVFNGSVYHSNTLPNNNMRAVINCNVV